MTEDDARRYAVLVNDLRQYGLHPAGQPVPDGWRPADFMGTEPECVRYVDQHWNELRPTGDERTGGG